MTPTVKSYHDLAPWVWEMVAAAVEYEDGHDSPGLHPEECATRPHLCACSIVEHVPDDVRAIALVAAQWREADRKAATEPEPTRVVVADLLPTNVGPDTECAHGLLAIGTVVSGAHAAYPGQVCARLDNWPNREPAWYDPSQLLVVHENNGLVRITKDHPTPTT